MSASDIVEGSLQVKLPTIWTDETQRWEESQKRREEDRRSKKRKSDKREDSGGRKRRKVAIHCVFPMICGSGGSKSRLAKAAGAEPSGQMRKHPTFGPLFEVAMSKKCTPLWRETHLQVKKLKTSGSDHFSKLRCRKSARRCATKHTAKSKCTKHHMFAQFLDVEASFCVACARDCAACQN